MNNNAEGHKKVCYELNRIYNEKNHDYGDAFAESYHDYGLIVAAIRIGDKYKRLHNICARNAELKVSDETIRDTLLDLANYCIMTVMAMDAEGEPYAKR